MRQITKTNDIIYSLIDNSNELVAYNAKRALKMSEK